MSSRKSRIKTTKSLPDLKAKQARTMPTSAAIPINNHHNGRPASSTPGDAKSLLPYKEENYCSKVLMGSWQERRITESLPKVPFEEAYMLGDKATAETATTNGRQPRPASACPLTRKDCLHDAIDHAYRVSRKEFLKNKTHFNSESVDDVHHPEPGTPANDQGAAKHTLYHQTYTLRNPRITGSQVHISAVGVPEMQYGLGAKLTKKWAKQREDAMDLTWKSTYQATYPADQLIPVERKYLNSRWRTQEGCIVIGNPRTAGTVHVDSEAEPVQSNRPVSRKQPRSTPC
ncbi:uncharacterized protein LOC129582022 [Paramacrobiotus metropolitanus]|uniref:uncharacterized protein LOC129582022 n=1 Tax=Paramacrobiotus metropolitanus TaxID=2943436 RepID=UPI00244644C4|nr:uncharacterized protein LOC129582022 [Paramacrobiotus metropolitanus]